MQPEARAAQSPKVILWSVECSAAVRCDPAQKRARVINRRVHSFFARAIEGQPIDADDYKHDDKTNQYACDELSHVLSIREIRS